MPNTFDLTELKQPSSRSFCHSGWNFPAGHHLLLSARSAADRRKDEGQHEARRIRTVLFARGNRGALMTAAVWPAAALDQKQAALVRAGLTDRTTILAYGVPDSEDVVLVFSCRPGAPAVKVTCRTRTAGPARAIVRVASGDRLARSGRIFHNAVPPNQNSGLRVELHAELPLMRLCGVILTSDTNRWRSTSRRAEQRYAEGRDHDRISQSAAEDRSRPCGRPEDRPTTSTSR